MPRGDATGPQGGGRMTGQQRGSCSGNNRQNLGRGGGRFGGGRGGNGRGFGPADGTGHGYGARSQAGAHQTGAPSSTPNGAELSQQLNTIIDQLSKLLDQSSLSEKQNNEKG